MSKENVDTIRSAWEAWMKGDATALAVLDSDVVYEDDLLPDHVGETYRGVDGLLKAWSIWAEPWDEFETDIEWVRDAGTDEVVSCHQRACSAREAGSRETSATPTWGDSGRARSSTASPSEIQTKPSEP